MAKMMVYGVVLTPEMARRIRVAAAAQGMSRSHLIRKMVEDYLARFELDAAVQCPAGGAGVPGGAGVLAEAGLPGEVVGLSLAGSISRAAHPPQPAGTE
jgi:hypothetical protein